jgi:hypothetical protein
VLLFSISVYKSAKAPNVTKALTILIFFPCLWSLLAKLFVSTLHSVNSGSTEHSVKENQRFVRYQYYRIEANTC